MRNFFKRENIFIEGIIFAFFMHLLFLLFLSTSATLTTLKNIGKNAPANQKNARLLVQLENPPPTQAPIDSFIVSPHSLTGSGQIAPSPDQRTHIQGVFRPNASLSQQSNPTNQRAPSQQQPSPSNLLTFIQAPLSIKASSPSTSPPSPNSSSGALITLSGLESENTTAFRFYIDDSNIRRPNIAKDPNATFFLNIIKAISYKMELYANSPQGAGSINYFYLKVDSVSALALIDRNGNISFQKLTVSSQLQPYMNYLIERVLSHQNALQKLPAWFLASTHSSITLRVTLSYKGPPLYQWWLSMDIVNPPALYYK